MMIIKSSDPWRRVSFRRCPILVCRSVLSQQGQGSFRWESSTAQNQWLLALYASRRCHTTATNKQRRGGRHRGHDWFSTILRSARCKRSSYVEMSRLIPYNTTLMMTRFLVPKRSWHLENHFLESRPIRELPTFFSRISSTPPKTKNCVFGWFTHGVWHMPITTMYSVVTYRCVIMTNWWVQICHEWYFDLGNIYQNLLTW